MRLPEYIIADSGPEEFQKTVASNGMKHSITVPYYAQLKKEYRVTCSNFTTVQEHRKALKSGGHRDLTGLICMTKI